MSSSTSLWDFFSGRLQPKIAFYQCLTTSQIKKRIKRLEEGIESFKKKGLTVMEKRCIAGKTVDISEDIAKYMRGRDE